MKHWTINIEWLQLVHNYVPVPSCRKYLLTNYRSPGISSVGRQGHFHFSKGTSIGKSYGKLLIKGHHGQDQGATKAKAPVACYRGGMDP